MGLSWDRQAENPQLADSLINEQMATLVECNGHAYLNG
jgi:hypothetical protein